MKVLIIEDEMLTAEDLKESLVSISSEIEVVSIVPSIKKAIEFLKTEGLELDLIFSDIELQDGKSFDVFVQIKPPCPVVFCTAYDEYALEAFRNNAVDYILKPFTKKDIENSLLKIEQLKASLVKNELQPYAHLKEEYAFRTKNILVHYQGRIIPIKTKDIDVFYKENELTYLYCVNGRKYILDRTLDSLEQELGKWFFRINRQAIVHHDSIREWSNLFNRKLELVLARNHGLQLEVSRNKVSDFLAWIKSL